MKEAALRGTIAVASEFEAATSNTSAVIARSLQETTRLANSDNELYATFYKLVQSGIRIPKGEKWDVLRAVADVSFFPNYHTEIRFASLSLDGTGLSNYGECTLVLRDHMIAHRASLLEENSVMFMKHHKIFAAEAHNLPQGYRATWDERGKLCVTKLIKQVSRATDPSEFPSLILRNGKTSEDDEFVEAHIWGPITIRTFERIIFTNLPKRGGNRAIMNGLREKLRKWGVQIEEA